MYLVWYAAFMDTGQRDIRGVLELVILKLVSERAMYGYEIIRMARERSDGALAWEEGVVYPCLHRLEVGGLVRSQWHTAENGRRRKYYFIAGKGAARLHERLTGWQRFCHGANAILLS